ncbi:MAG: glycosyltransferase family 4 protein [Solirubrobacterales bacterium]|nr:glycosyltransferase family 4 protein [Solirubrobacterales bacterium]
MSASATHPRVRIERLAPMTGSRGTTAPVAPVRAAGTEPILVHDYLLVHRGAERAFAAIAACWPDAPIASLLYDEQVMGPQLPGHAVRTSGLQRLGVGQRGFRALLPLFPSAASRLPVAGHDLVVSSSSAFAHGVRPDPGAVHVCYCYTPFRYAWHERERAMAEVPAVSRPALAATLALVRKWDLKAAERVTHYVAISEFCRERIERTYGRSSEVIYPPVQTTRFEPGEVEDFYLVVTELVRHKRVDVALEAAKRAGQAIKVVGEGPDLPRLKALYGDSAQFVGRLSDEELAQLYPRALALIVPNVEEFGIAAVEAQAAGRPVIAPDDGGTHETVVDGETGVLLATASVDEITDAMTATDFTGFDPARCVAQAAQYSTATFQARFKDAVERAVARGPRQDA